MRFHAALLLAMVGLVACHGQHHYGGEGKGMKPSDYDQNMLPKEGMLEDMPPGPGPMPPRPFPPGPPGPMMPCRMDFMRFCAFRVSDMQNPEVIVECMMSHEADLVPECKEDVAKLSQLFNDFHAACDAPMKTFYPADTNCTDELPHKPWLYRQCVINHLPDLGHSCLSEISTILKMHHAGGPPHGPPGPPHGPPGPPGPPGPGPHQVPEWAVMPNDDGRSGDGMMPGGPGDHGRMEPGHESQDGMLPGPDSSFHGSKFGASAFCMLLGAGTMGAFIALLTVHVGKKVARKYCRSRAALTPVNDHLLPVGLAASDGKYMHTNTGTAMAYCPMA